MGFKDDGTVWCSGASDAGFDFSGFSRRFLEVAFSLLDTLPVMQQFGEGFHRERLAAEAAEIALADVAALVTQVPELFAGFDAFGDHRSKMNLDSPAIVMSI